MADLQKNVNWDGLVYYDGKIKKFIKDKLSPCFKFGGLLNFDELPLPDEEEYNFVYQILDQFISSNMFDIPNKFYEAGTLIYVTKIEDVYKFKVLVESPTIDPSEIKARIDSLDAITDSHTNDLEDITKCLNDQDKQISDLDTSISTLETVIEEQKNLVSSIQLNISDIQGSIDSLDGRLDLLEDLPEKVELIEEDLNLLKTKVDSNQEALKELKTSCSDLQSEKQNKLISGVSIATINGHSLLNGGNIEIKNEDLVFKVDKETEIEVGGIPVGSNLNGLTYAEILEKIFFKTSADVNVDVKPTIIEDTYATSYTGVSTGTSFSSVGSGILEENIQPEDEGLYKIYNESGELTQIGYQMTVPASGGRTVYSQVLLSFQPSSILYYNSEIGDEGWVECNRTWDLIKTVKIESINGDILTYYLYQDSQGSSGDSTSYRFVI